MKLITHRRRVAVLAAMTVLASSALVAAPAQAFPAKAWWYNELSVAQAQKITQGSGVTVAVLDSGVQASLPDLQGQVLPGKSFVGSGDARTDVHYPGVKYFGHGTAMAAYIAGTGRGAGLVGIAPKAKILPAGNSKDGLNSSGEATLQAIPWAVQHGAKIINISSGSPVPCPAAMQQAVDDAIRHDVIVVAATGNVASDPVSEPANCIGVIAVGGLADATAFTPWSGGSTGPELDFVAPAQKVIQLFLDNTLSEPGNSGGTSPAAAFVSGTLALLRSRWPHDSARQIVTRALYGVHNGFGHGIFAKRIDDKLGYGEILPYYALTHGPPSNAKNPIYDAWDKHAKATSSAPASSSPASSPAPASPSSNASGGSGSSSSTVLLIAGIAVLVVVIALIGVVTGRRSRRRHAPGSYGPPPYGGA